MSLKPRILSFIVEGQKLKKDPNCDFSSLVAGTKGYYYAQFSFDQDWKDYKKVAAFSGTTGPTEYIPIVNGQCQIPDTIVENLMYYVGVYGMADGVTIPTTQVTVRQSKGDSNG